MTSSEPGPSRVQVWWRAARPSTLLVSVSPVLAGTALAYHDGHLRIVPALLALCVAVAMQLGVNYANDYSDFVRGADARRVGPMRAASSGIVPPKQVKWAAIAVFTVACVLGLALSFMSDWRLVLVGAAAVVAGWLYTGGPKPYGYIGLGELFVFVFFGLVATVGTVYVQELRITPSALLIGASMGLLPSAVLSLNNLRDVDTDKAAGKRTLAVLLGRDRTRTLVAAYFVVALLLPVLAVAYAGVPLLAVVSIVVAPVMLQVYRASASHEPRVLIAALKRAAMTEFWFAALFSAGVIASNLLV